MTDLTVYVAVVTGVFTVIGATIPQVSTVIQNGRQAKHAEREQYKSAKRDACVALLRSAGKLRTQLADNQDYHGGETAERRALVRKHAAAVQVNAASVALLVPKPLADFATELAETAARLAVSAENPKVPLEFGEFDKRVDAFTAEAVRTSQG